MFHVERFYRRSRRSFGFAPDVYQVDSPGRFSHMCPSIRWLGFHSGNPVLEEGGVLVHFLHSWFTLHGVEIEPGRRFTHSEPCRMFHFSAIDIPFDRNKKVQGHALWPLVTA